MNRLVIVQLLPALHNGGVERGTVEVANYLAKLGHTSIVISAGGAMVNQFHEKVKHINLKVGKKSLLSFFLIAKLKKLFIKHKADIIHARSRMPAWLAYFAIARIKSNKPQFITTIHGLYSVKKYSSIMARGDLVIAVSQTAKNYVEDNFSNDLKTTPQLIYRGINPSEFPYGYVADLIWMGKFYEKNHQLVGKKMVLLPGRITTLKGIKELKTWLSSINNETKLVLTANYEQDLKAAKLYYWFKENNFEDKVIWVGLQKSMSDLYAIADIVVSCSTRAESFGRTVLESLSIGTPVVGYNHGGVGEILTEIFPQGLVEFNNKQQLAQSINQLLEQPVKVANKQPFLLKNMLSQTLQLYQGINNDS